jgi:hypothetical protein
MAISLCFTDDGVIAGKNASNEQDELLSSNIEKRLPQLETKSFIQNGGKGL